MSYNPANYPIFDSDVLRGSLLMTFDNPNNDANAFYTVSVNSALRDQEYSDTNDLFSTYLYVGDVVTVTIFGGGVSEYLDVTRTDYTTDVIDEDDGIRTINITNVSGSDSVTFTATTISTSYNFEYHVDLGTISPPAPTPTPSITATPTVTPSITTTQTPTPTPSVTPTFNPSQTPTITPTISPSPTPNYGNLALSSFVINTGANSGYTYNSFNSGLDWSIQNNNITTSYVKSIRSSLGGQYQTKLIQNNGPGSEGYIYRSTNFGASFTQLTSAGLKFWETVRISYSGQYQIIQAAFNDKIIYVSSDYGATWTPKTLLATSTVTRAVGISGDGKYQIATCGYKEIFGSSDYGVTWSLIKTVTTTTVGQLYAAALSSDGQYQSVSASDNVVHISSDYGVTWTKSSTLPQQSQYRHIEMSASGQYQIMNCNSRTAYILKSSDYGANWAYMFNSSFGGSWGISISTSGQYMLDSNSRQKPGIVYGPMRISSDYGENWYDSNSGTGQFWDLFLTF